MSVTDPDRTGPDPRPNPRPRPETLRLPDAPTPPAARLSKVVTRPAVLLGVGAVLVVAVVALSVLLVLRSGTADDLEATNDARASALSSARRYAVDFTTYDYRTFDDNLRRIEAELTGGFKKRYLATAAALKASVVQYQAVGSAKLHAVAVQSVHEHDAVVLAFVDQTVRFAGSTTPRISSDRMQLTLHREGGGPWLITDLQLI